VEILLVMVVLEKLVILVQLIVGAVFQKKTVVEMGLVMVVLEKVVQLVRGIVCVRME
jgi:hypothetical protein